MQVGIMAMVLGMGIAQAQVTELIDGLVWAQPADGQAAVARLLELGEPAVHELCAKLRDPASGEDDSKVRFALEGMVVTVMRDPADPRRTMLAKVFSEAMTTAALPEVKSYLIRNLARVGMDETVLVLAPQLADPAFCEPAVQALLHIGSPAAGTALAAALPQATGGERLTLIRALGQLRQTEAVQAVLPLAGDENVQTRLAAWYALANCGIAAVDPALQEGARSEDVFVASRARRGRLLLARRLAEAGQGAAGEAMVRDVLVTPLTPATRQVVCAALATWVDMAGERAVPELVAAVASPDWQVREAALNLAAELHAGRAACVSLLPAETNPDIRAAVVAMLGRTGDGVAKTVVLAALADPELTVRQAAAQASLAFGLEGMEALLAYAGRSDSAEDAKAAREALSQVREAELTVRLGALLPTATPTGKVVMLAVLAARNASDQSPVVLAEMGGQDRDVVKAALSALETLGRTRDVPAVLEFFSTTGSSSARNGARSVLVAICRRDGSVLAPILVA
jgi:HEAT repeat protein